MLVQPKGFADGAADAIALDRTAGRPHRDGQSQARTADAIGFRSHRKESITKAPSARIGGLEVGLAAQATLRGKSKPPSHRSSCGRSGKRSPWEQRVLSRPGFLILGYQLPAALRATPCQNSPAVLGG